MAKLERNYQWTLNLSMNELMVLRKALDGKTDLTDDEDHIIDVLVRIINQVIESNKITERVSYAG